MKFLRYCGFGQAITFKTITDVQIDEVEKFIREDISKLIPIDTAKENIYGPIFTKNPSRFKFMPGHRALIKILVSHVKKIVDENGNNSGLSYFKSKNEINIAEVPSAEQLNDTRAHSLLKKLLSSADQNSTKKKGGYRFSKEIQHFTTYLRLIVGKLGYETLHRNLEPAIPSLPSIDRYIRSSHFNITPAVLRTEELLQYLEQRNLPKIVSLSEDMTRIVGRIQYDSRTNQLFGFTHPINRATGMPVPHTFPARHAREIMNHFVNGTVAGYLNVVMAQPIANNASAFCLLLYASDNKFTANNVVRRWEYIKNELNKVGIVVLTISSDSDPRYNSAMRELSGLGESPYEFAKWFSSNKNMSPPFSIQDMIHIITKMRNFFLRTLRDAKKLPFGDFYIDISHVYVLLYMHSKDKHLLTESDLNPADRQNFASATKMCSEKVTNMLDTYIDGAEATSLYLQMMRSVCSAYMGTNLLAIERVRAMFYPLFLMRIWRDYISDHKKYTLKDNFMTMNCYCCIEMNAHALVKLILYLKKINRPELFLPNLFESQPCESIFRQFRSLTSVYSTVTNCTLKEACSRISKIQIQNEIIHMTSDEFTYPRLQKNTEVTKTDFDLPSESEIYAEIENCQRDAIATARKFGLISKQSKTKIYQCKVNSLKTNIERPQITEANIFEPEDISRLDLRNIQLKDYTGKFENTTIDETSPYVGIVDDYGERTIVKKTSLCWLLQRDCPKLSSDRLLRVRNAAKKLYSVDHHNQKQNPKKKKTKRLLRSYKK